MAFHSTIWEHYDYITPKIFLKIEMSHIIGPKYRCLVVTPSLKDSFRAE